MSCFELNPTTPVLLAGPTAVGKTEVALLLAEKLNGEIISVDSMQVYRGLDIGTAKPAPAERARIPHHLLDVVELTEAFDASQFVQLAKAAAEDIQHRGHTPIFCGGTGLYFKAYLEGLGEAPPTSAALRAELESTPLPKLLEELVQADPATFEKIDRKNPRRVYRAIAVIRLTGKPFSAQRVAWSADKRPTVPFFGLMRAPEELQERINQRVERMFAQGLVAETEALLQKGLAHNKIAMQALGYRQVVEYLRQERGLPETIELVKQRTRKFAKRQLTWFRRQAGLQWIEATPSQSAEEIVTGILKEMTKGEFLKNHR